MVKKRRLRHKSVLHMITSWIVLFFKIIIWGIKKIIKIALFAITFSFDIIYRGIKKIGESIWSLNIFLRKTAAPKIKKEIKKSRRMKSEPEYDAFRELKTIEGEIEKFEKWLYRTKSTIGIILGARGTGKSALGMRILENMVEQGVKVCAMGFREKNIPNWIDIIENIDEAPNNCTLLVDESGIVFSSRQSMSDANKLLSNLMLVARHKDISIIFISQNSSNLEINSIRQADYLLLKQPSLLQKDFERRMIQKIYSQVSDDFKELEKDAGLLYIYSDKFRGFVSNTLPSFWSESISKSFESKKIKKKT